MVQYDNRGRAIYQQENKEQEDNNLNYDSSQLEIGNAGNPEYSQMYFGGGGNNASQLDNFVKKHQDATLNKNHWVPDHKAKQCFECDKEFTFFYRKHHCRICGNVFCHNCTTVKAIINNGLDQRNVRMCQNCEKMIDTYSKNLRMKNNLLNADQRNSQFNADPNRITFTGEQEDHKINVNGMLMSVEEQKQYENYKKGIENLETNFKADAATYLQNIDDEKSSFITGENSMLEKNIMNTLKGFSSYHIQNIVFDMIKHHQIDADKWGAQLLEFVKTAVDNVKPSSRLLNDSMNFNSFIKIKIINWKDNSKSAYINGVVMNKNLADKRMLGHIQNPSILLLKESVGLKTNAVLSDIQSVVDQEEHWVDIVKQKLTQVKPNIIIVEKDVGYKVLDALREEKITVITNLGHHKMKRMARYTQTIISPSYNVIDKSFVLGKCKQFRVEQPYTGNQIQRLQLEQQDKGKQGGVISNDRSLLFFEGTNPALGCTILLSGQMALELEELKKVKQALREMLKLARNVILERQFLLQIYAQIPKYLTDDNQVNLNESPFLITRNIQNRQTLVLSKVIMKKGAATTLPTAGGTNAQVNTSMQISPLPGGKTEDYGGAVDFQGNPLTVYQIQNYLQHQGRDPRNNQLSKMGKINSKVNENYVKTKIDSMCGCPKKEKMEFYSRQNDETIGNMLKKLCKEATTVCENCKEPMYKHFQQYYHKDGCVEIQLQLTQPNDPLRRNQNIQAKQPGQEKKSRDIIMRGECTICNKQVTPDTIMSNQFYEYSKGRFFEQFFYNGDKLVNQNAWCNHRSLKDIQRVFIIPGGFQITFTFIPLEVFSIEMLQPKKQDTSIIFIEVIEEKKRSMQEGLQEAYKDLKKRRTAIEDFINDEQRAILSEEQEKKSFEMIIQFVEPLVTIKQSLKDFEVDISKIIGQFSQPIQEIDSIFAAMFLERKLLLNLLTYSKVLDGKDDDRQDMTFNNLNNTMGADQFEIGRTESDKGPVDIMSKAGNVTERSTHIMMSQLPNISQLARKNSLLTEQQQLETLDYIKQAQMQKFIEDFITGTEKQYQQLVNVSMQNIPQSTKVSPMYVIQQNYEAAKQFIQSQQQIYIERLNKKFKNEQQFMITGDRNIMVMKQEEEEKSQLADNNNPNRTRDGSEYFKVSKNPTSTNLSKPNLVDFNQTINQMADNKDNSFNDHHEWIEYLQNGYVTMPLGTDNLYVPLDENDIGSIIAYVLGSNIYKEAMIKHNYMDIGSKVKILGKHPRQGFGASNDPQPTPMGIRESTINMNFAGATQFQQQQLVDETIKLYGKDDVFNFELSSHQIETELLCGEKLYFMIKFSTEEPDFKLRMVKNDSVQKQKNTQLTFQTGYQATSKSNRIIQGMEQYQKKTKKKTDEVKKNDLQEKVCKSIPKDYLDNQFYRESTTKLDSIIKMLNTLYFDQSNYQINMSKVVSPIRSQLATQGQDESQLNADLTQEQFALIMEQTHSNDATGRNMRESVSAATLMAMKSPPQVMSNVNTPMIGGNVAANSQNPLSNIMLQSQDEFCGVVSPMKANTNSWETLKQELKIPKVEFELKVYFPKKFEALRRFYCGSQYNFIQSLLQTKEWTTVTGGKTKSKFYRSIDDKYVFKQIKKSEFKMFLEFAPQYFDYLCKSFFHNYPCALCKILGAFKIKITNKENKEKPDKKYIYIIENLNFGIKPEDEDHIIRYDLKGSSLNRFVKNKENKESGRVVLHDNNFLLEFMGRPLPIRYTINRILHICINNDTLCLSKSNIVDYSLLTIIDTKRKKVRFGIIDYVQQYTLDKIFESKFKSIAYGGEVPTIVDPEKYKQRFKKAMKRYFVGMCIQEEKSPNQQLGGKNDTLEAQDEYSDDEDGADVNETTLRNADPSNQVSIITGKGEIEILESDRDTSQPHI